MAVARPSMIGVLETVLYFTDAVKTRHFYEDILGMRYMAGEPGRSLFFRAGQSVFLLFYAPETLKGGRLPAHGATGPSHTCFVVPPEEYERWKTYLTEQGIPILQEVQWSTATSFYFHDPDGNVLEIADRVSGLRLDIGFHPQATLCRACGNLLNGHMTNKITPGLQC